MNSNYKLLKLNAKCELKDELMRIKLWEAFSKVLHEAKKDDSINVRPLDNAEFRIRSISIPMPQMAFDSESQAAQTLHTSFLKNISIALLKLLFAIFDVIGFSNSSLLLLYPT